MSSSIRNDISVANLYENYDQEIIIYGAKKIKSIGDVSNLNPSTMLISNAKKLTSIKCTSPFLVNTDISDCVLLQNIDLRDCSVLGGAGSSPTLNMANTNYLKYINVSGTKLTAIYTNLNGGNIEEIYYPTTLQAVNVKNQPRLTKMIIPSGCTNLSNVSIINCPNLSSFSDDLVNPFASLSYVQNLTIQNSLNLTSMSFAGFNRLANLSLTDLPTLASCGFDDMNNIGDTATLKSVSISNCPNIEKVTMNVSNANKSVLFGADCVMDLGGAYAVKRIESNTVIRGLKTIVLGRNVEDLIFTRQYGTGTSDLKNLWSYETANSNASNSYLGIDFQGLTVKNIDLSSTLLIPNTKNFNLSPVNVFNLNGNRDGVTYPLLPINGTVNLTNFTGSCVGLFKNADLRNTTIIMDKDFAKTDFTSMFEGAIFNTSTDISSLMAKIKNATNCTRMFANSNITTTYMPSGFGSSANLTEMFSGCNGLTSVNITIPSGVTKISGLLKGCRNITNVNAFNIIDTVTNIAELFSGCLNLLSVNGITFGSGITTATNWQPPSLETANNITVKSNILKALFKGNTTVKYINNLTITPSIIDLSNCFDGCTSLLEMSFVANTDLSSITSIIYMLRGTKVASITFNNILYAVNVLGFASSVLNTITFSGGYSRNIIKAILKECDWNIKVNYNGIPTVVNTFDKVGNTVLETTDTLECSSRSLEIQGQTYQNLISGLEEKTCKEDWILTVNQGSGSKSVGMDNTAELTEIQGQTYQNLISNASAETVLVDAFTQTVTSPSTSYSGGFNVFVEEVQGNTVQNSTNLSDIQSVGVFDGSGNYRVEVLSEIDNTYQNKFEINKILNNEFYLCNLASADKIYRSYEFIFMLGSNSVTGTIMTTSQGSSTLSFDKVNMSLKFLSETICSISINTMYKMNIVYNNGTTNFYIDNVLKYTSSVALPQYVGWVAFNSKYGTGYSDGVNDLLVKNFRYYCSAIVQMPTPLTNYNKTTFLLPNKLMGYKYKATSGETKDLLIADNVYWDNAKGKYCLKTYFHNSYTFNGNETIYSYLVDDTNDSTGLTSRIMLKTSIPVTTDNDVLKQSDLGLSDFNFKDVGFMQSWKYCNGFNLYWADTPTSDVPYSKGMNAVGLYGIENNIGFVFRVLKSDYASTNALLGAINGKTITWMSKPKIIDLPTLNTKQFLTTYPTTYTSIGNGTVNASSIKVSTDVWKKDAMLLPNTQYTLIADMDRSTGTGNVSYNLGGASGNVATTSGYKYTTTTITTPSTLTNNQLTLSGLNNKVKNVMVLKGSGQETLSYFDGIQSFGEYDSASNSYKIEVLSQGKNIFDSNLLYYTYNTTAITLNSISSNSFSAITTSTSKFGVRFNLIAPRDGTLYVGANLTNIEVFVWGNTEGSFIHSASSNGVKFNCIKNRVYQIDFKASTQGVFSANNIQVEYDGHTSFQYTSNKKQLLLDEPLRKVGNAADRVYYDYTKGKYCVERKIGKFSIENLDWTILDSYPSNNDDTIFAYTTSNLPSNLLRNPNVIANNLTCTQNSYVNYRPSINVLYNELDAVILAVRLLRSKLIAQDKMGVSKWLSDNKVILYYGLETPTIEELAYSDQMINTYTPTTYISTNSIVKPSTTKIESITPATYKPSLLPSTQYTMIFDVDKNNSANNVTYNVGGTTGSIATTNGYSHKQQSITTPSTLSTNTFKITGEGNKVKNVMLIPSSNVETLDYFDGISSYGTYDSTSGKYKVEVISKNQTSTESNTKTFLLPQQLYKVGSVADRLYWDSGKGHYCIEKNINYPNVLATPQIIDLPQYNTNIGLLRLWQDKTVVNPNNIVKPSKVKFDTIEVV